jgi:CRISPR type III-A-associated protein Csm2
VNESKGGPPNPSGAQRPLGLKKPGGSSHGGGQRHAAGGAGVPPPKLPKPETIHYFKENKPDPALLDTRAEEIAQELARAGLKATQLRRYYDEVLHLRQRLSAEARHLDGDREKAFAILRTDFRMLKAKAAYAHGRDRALFPWRLLKFFIDHVHSVNSVRDFDVFFQHFQAVVAFHKFYKPGRD